MNKFKALILLFMLCSCSMNTIKKQTTYKETIEMIVNYDLGYYWSNYLIATKDKKIYVYEFDKNKEAVISYKTFNQVENIKEEWLYDIKLYKDSLYDIIDKFGLPCVDKYSSNKDNIYVSKDIDALIYFVNDKYFAIYFNDRPNKDPIVSFVS